MSTITSGINLPIPTASDDYRDGFDAIADLGNALDTYLTPVARYPSVIEYDADWRIDSAGMTRVGGLVYVRGQATFVRGSALSVPSDGNIGNDTVAYVLENGSGIRPPVGVFSLSSGGTGRAAAFIIQPSATFLATIHLVALAGSADLPNNGVLTFSGFYIETPPA